MWHPFPVQLTKRRTWDPWNIWNRALFYIIVCSEIPFSKSSYHIENSESIWKTNQFTAFCMIRVFTERYFRADISDGFQTLSNATKNLALYLIASSERKELNKSFLSVNPFSADFIIFKWPVPADYLNLKYLPCWIKVLIERDRERERERVCNFLLAS